MSALPHGRPAHRVRSPGAVPVAVLGSCDPIARDVVASGLVLGGPDIAVLRYDHRRSDERLEVWRRLVDRTGVVWADEIAGGADCACCVMRDDLPTALDTVIGSGRWAGLALLPPLAAPLGPLTTQLDDLAGLTEPSNPSGRSGPTDTSVGWLPGAVLAVVDLPRLVDDLFGDDLIDERGVALSPQDRRAVGEALVEHLEVADRVVGCGGRDDTAEVVLDRLVGPRWRVDWTGLDEAEVFGSGHDAVAATERTDPLRVELPHPDDEAERGVWTLRLRSDRPVHPGRLMQRLDDLGSGRIRARGHLWLASRPDTPCVWDASGGQLSIGTLPGWGPQVPGTRLDVVGVQPDERPRIAAAFGEVICRPEEAAEPAIWSRRPDGFEPWLGEISRLTVVS